MRRIIRHISRVKQITNKFAVVVFILKSSEERGSMKIKMRQIAEKVSWPTRKSEHGEAVKGVNMWYTGVVSRGSVALVSSRPLAPVKTTPCEPPGYQPLWLGKGYHFFLFVIIIIIIYFLKINRIKSMGCCHPGKCLGSRTKKKIHVGDTPLLIVIVSFHFTDEGNQPVHALSDLSTVAPRRWCHLPGVVGGCRCGLCWKVWSVFLK